MERFPLQTEVSSTTIYRRKEADRATFSPVLPCFAFPPIYASRGNWRTDGLKVPIFLLAIPARPSPEVPAVTLQWTSNTFKREWTALIQLSLKEHTGTLTRSKEIKKINYSILTQNYIWCRVVTGPLKGRDGIERDQQEVKTWSPLPSLLQ